MKGVFQDSIIAADGGDHPPGTVGDQAAAHLYSDGGVEGEGSDSVIEGTLTSPKVTSRPPHLNSDAGRYRPQLQPGEGLDSDIDMPELPPVRASPSPQPTPLKVVFKGLDLGLGVEEAHNDPESEESSAGTATPAPERAPTRPRTQM